jgi:hypothetical protein
LKAMQVTLMGIGTTRADLQLYQLADSLVLRLGCA